MRLALLSDTHMPKAGRRLPDDCLARAPHRTMGIATVERGMLAFELVVLG